MPREVDALDLEVIRLLQEDGRRPTVAIARQLGQAEATVRRRLDRLLHEGVIRVVAVADGEKLGLPIHMLIGIQVDLAQAEAIGAALARLEEVRWVGATTGPQEYVVEAYFRSNRHFHEFLVQRLARIPGVLRTQTSTVLQLVKNVYRWDVLMEAGPDDPEELDGPERVPAAGAPPKGSH